MVLGLLDPNRVRVCNQMNWKNGEKREKRDLGLSRVSGSMEESDSRSRSQREDKQLNK